MHGDSRPIHSAQTAPHPRLQAVLERHRDSIWQAPVHAPTRKAFDRLRRELAAEPRSIVLDSGCGTGQSTMSLATHHPDDWVVGVDQSAARLSRLAPTGYARQGNAFFVRAELASFWRLFVDAGFSAQRHFLLYPNPWPKAAQLGRRWHGHPVFPTLMRSAATFELRSNWRVYAEEFAHALQFAGHAEASVAAFEAHEPLSPFERKYRDSGHALWRVTT